MLRISQKSVLSFLLVSTAFVGCSERRERPSLKLQREVEIHQQVAQGRNAEAAATAAALGELLLVPSQFVEADVLFDKALKHDAKNAKANFYGAFLKPVLALKGFTKKFGPVLGAKDTRAMANLERDLKKLPEHFRPLANHLTELGSGEQPTANLAAVQVYFRKHLIPAFAIAQKRLAVAIDMGGVELLLSPRAWSSSADSLSAENCKPGDQGWECSRPDSALELRADVADLQAISSVLSGYLDYFRLFAAYELTDAEKLVAEYEKVKSSRQARGLPFTAKDVTKLIRKYPKFALLSGDQELTAMAGSLESTLKTVIDLQAAEARLCQSAERKADAVLVKSICIAASELDFASRTLEALSGPTPMPFGRNEIRVNLGALLLGPPQDLKSLLPKEGDFDSRGEVAALSERTLGGLFPDGDFFEKASQLGKPGSINTSGGVSGSARRLLNRVRYR